MKDDQDFNNEESFQEESQPIKEDPYEEKYEPESPSKPKNFYDPKEYGIDFTTKESKEKSLFLIIQMAAWLFFLICGWLSLRWLDNNYMVYSIIRITGIGKYYYALQMSSHFIWFLTICLLMVSTITFGILFVKHYLKIDDEFNRYITRDFVKFYPVVLVFNGVLFIIGMCSTSSGTRLKDQEISGLFFVILTLGGTVYIKIILNKTPKTHWTIVYLKKGFFSSLLAYNSYYFFYVICQLAEYNHREKISVYKGLGVGIGILMGVVMLAVAFVLTDYAVGFFYFVAYIGIVNYHYELSKEYRKSIGLSAAEVIFGIIFIVLFLGMCFLNLWAAVGKIRGVDTDDDFALLNWVLKKKKKSK